MSENKDMNPVSNEEVEIDGVYEDRFGRQVELSRGQLFPPDEQLGTMEWNLVEVTNDAIHPVKHDPKSQERKHIARFRGDR